MQEIIKNNIDCNENLYGFHYVQEMHQSFVHHFYITGDIGPAQYYIEMIHVIRSCNQGDVVYIHLNTTGGQLDTGIQIINAMKESEAHIICSIEAQAFSLGSMIFLCGDDYIVHDNSVLMIHNYNGALSGKGNEQLLRLEAITTLFDAFVRPIYLPFISEEEFTGVIEGKDIWLQADQIRKRLENMLKINASPEEKTKTTRKRKSTKS